MEYVRTAGGFEPLPRRNVDFGGGLARIAAAAMDSNDVFRINSLWPIIEQLQDLSGRSYENETTAMRVVADHLRGATFLAVDGVLPSNKAQGYVMRRLVRRPIRYAFDLGLQQNFFPEVIPAVVAIYADDYPEVRERQEIVIAALVKEEKAFRLTLAKGIRQLKAYRSGVSGSELFVLYDTFGFPVELSTEEARRSGIPVSQSWTDEFEAQMTAQRDRSQQARNLKV